MIEHRLRPLLNPRSIAVVGASVNRESFGWTSWQAIRQIGFTGEFFLVNPRYDDIDGERCFPDIASIGRPVEHAMLNVSNPRLERVFDEAIAAGVKAVTIFASCYLANDGDPPLLERLRRKAREASLLVCGGNGAGFVNREERVQVTLAGGRSSLDAGPVTLISQSGSIYLGMLQTDGRLGFNLTVTSGQEIAVTAGDYMDYALG
ncbi:MAG: CoA-binding protein, partial [Alphaproteobacteria bacterium]|nr:CoA-binding protein [Alphaproteobacteria bacterium]